MKAIKGLVSIILVLSICSCFSGDKIPEVKKQTGQINNQDQNQEKQGTLSGKVVTEEGAVVPGVVVIVYDSEGEIIGQATTDDEGNFTITVPEGTNYKVEVTSLEVDGVVYDGISLTDVTIIDGQTTQLPVINLPKTVIPAKSGTISGKLVDENGNPLVGVVVEIYKDGVKSQTISTNINGAFSVIVEEGSGYKVKIPAFSNGGKDYKEFIKDEIIITADGTVNIGVVTLIEDILPVGIITGVIANSDEAPVAGTSILVKDEQGNILANTTTNNDGSFSVTVNEGEDRVVVIEASGTNKEFIINDVDVNIGETTNLGAVQVMGKGVVVGSVLSFADGTTVVGAKINIYNENGVVVGSTTTDSNGNFGINIFEGYNYSIEVESITYNGITYDRASKSGIRVEVNKTTQIGSVYVTDNVDRNDGAIQGIIIDGIEGSRIANALIEVHVGGANGPIAKLVDRNGTQTQIDALANTDSTGFFKIGSELENQDSLLDGQIYTILVKKDGYTYTVAENVAIDGLTDVGNIAIVPELPTGEIKITLKWQSDGYDYINKGIADAYKALKTKDLDGHLVGPKNEGGLFHVYWNDKNADGSLDGSNSNGTNMTHPYEAWQDIDDTLYCTKNGETITLKVDSSFRAAGIYYYTVHNWSSHSIDTDWMSIYSNAVVTVYDTYGILSQTSIEPNSGWSNNGWKVFALNISSDMKYSVQTYNVGLSLIYNNSSTMSFMTRSGSQKTENVITEHLQGKVK